LLDEIAVTVGVTDVQFVALSNFVPSTLIADCSASEFALVVAGRVSVAVLPAISVIVPPSSSSEPVAR
jgi:hypothetical protein